MVSDAVPIAVENTYCEEFYDLKMVNYNWLL